MGYIKNMTRRVLDSSNLLGLYWKLHGKIYAKKRQYTWPYLKKTKIRGKILFNIIKPYLKLNDNFLDINCGYSPLASHVLHANHRIVGFDINPYTIRYLRRHFPRGSWYCTSYKNFNMKDFSIFLLFGPDPAVKKKDPSFQEFLLRLLKHNNPRLIFLETCKSHASSVNFYNEIIALVMEKEYIKLDGGEYDSKMKSSCAIRVFTLFGRCW